MTGEEVAKWLEGQADFERHDADKAEAVFGEEASAHDLQYIAKLEAMAATVRALVEAGDEASKLIGDLTSGKPETSVLPIYGRLLTAGTALRRALGKEAV